jgi:hypothetical protein
LVQFVGGGIWQCNLEKVEFKIIIVTPSWIKKFEVWKYNMRERERERQKEKVT